MTSMLSWLGSACVVSLWESIKSVTAESKGRKRPRDPNQLAKFIVDVASGQIEDRDPYASGAGERPRCRQARSIWRSTGRTLSRTSMCRSRASRNASRCFRPGVMRPRGSAGSRASLRSPK